LSDTNSKFTFNFFTSISQIGQQIWDECALDSDPCCHYAFLHALESSGSVGAQSGWSAQHLLVCHNNQAIAVLPLYQKQHSYGEYIFDFAWANTYKHYGVDYYPKLICAIPFTPVTGARIMLKAGFASEEVLPLICQQIEQHMHEHGMSSIHWLFVDKETSANLATNGQLSRHSVQFQWFNQQYSSFEHYLERFSSRKRKNIKKERAAVLQQNITVARLCAQQLTKQDMRFFYHCYTQTYLKRSGHHGYLTEAFFQQIFETMANNLMLVIAYKDDEPVASALFIYDEKKLFGRYWGALQELDNLHFECCYYQGIEFCIEQNIAQFNPGTQGEHKISRGFEPIYCYSNHSLKEKGFHQAVSDFIVQEKLHIAQYKQQTQGLLPFKVP
jgi:predicted N-acyltransferase